MRRYSTSSARTILALIVIAFVMGLGPSASRSSVWDFEGDEPREIPRTFSSESGQWEVVQDGHNRVMVQQAENRLEQINLALVSNSSDKDLDLSVRMKAVAGENERGGGLVFRAKDKNNYYVARYNPYIAKNNPRPPSFRLYKYENGIRTQMDHANAPEDPLEPVPGGVADGTVWHTLRVTMHGDEITGYLDGHKLLQAEDTTFRDAGKIGLWSKSDARSWFDDLTVSKFPTSESQK